MFAESCSIVLLLCCSVWGLTEPERYSLPSDFPTCRRDDPEINECSRAAFQEWLQRTKDGIESLGIPPLDPLKIGRLNYAYDNGVFSGVVKLKKITVVGIADSVVERVDLKYNDTSLSWKLDTFAPKINVVGNYASELRIQQYKLTPKGAFNMTFYNITFKTSTLGNLYKRDGYTFWNITYFDTPLPEVGDFQFNITGLFQDESINEISLNYVKKNWRRILDILWPETWKMWEAFLKEKYNKFFEIAPIEKLFPEE